MKKIYIVELVGPDGTESAFCNDFKEFQSLVSNLDKKYKVARVHSFQGTGYEEFLEKKEKLELG